MRAAIPAYLPDDFEQAPPGHRFGLYLEAWDNDFELGKEGKADAIGKVLTVPGHSAAALEALRDRQLAAVSAYRPEDALILDANATAPFATGLGIEHPVENGFAFLQPYGLPYLPGSGVKGVLRRAACELAEGLFGGTAGWTAALIDALFGSQDVPHRGALTFWDAIPSLPNKQMRLDIMTPHQTEYYCGNESPHDSGLPTPIPFLTVPPKAEFRFIVTCEERLLSVDDIKNGKWRPLLRAALEHAFDWLGFGAKTAVGYGAMSIDRRRDELAQRAEREREAAEKARRDAEEAAARKAETERARLAAIDAMSESDRLMHFASLAYDAAAAVVGDLARASFTQALLTRIKPISEQAHQWSPEDRNKAAELLEKSYDLIGWFERGLDKKKRQKQEDKKRARIDAIRQGNRG